MGFVLRFLRLAPACVGVRVGQFTEALRLAEDAEHSKPERNVHAHVPVVTLAKIAPPALAEARQSPAPIDALFSGGNVPALLPEGFSRRGWWGRAGPASWDWARSTPRRQPRARNRPLVLVTGR
jgi:hypothetical protein